jgi:hypothetical protein
MNKNLWFYNPCVLVTEVPKWPFNPHLSNTSRQNSVAQFVLLVTLALSLIKKSTLPLIGGLVLLLLNFLVCDQFKRQPKQSMARLLIDPRKEYPAGQIPSQQQTQQMQQYVNQMPWAPQTMEYPNNPSFLEMQKAAYSQMCPGQVQMPMSNSLSRMFNPVDIVPFDQMAFPIPDPTHMARMWTPTYSDFASSANVMRDRKLGYIW